MSKWTTALRCPTSQEECTRPACQAEGWCQLEDVPAEGQGEGGSE